MASVPGESRGHLPAEIEAVLAGLEGDRAAVDAAIQMAWDRQRRA